MTPDADRTSTEAGESVETVTTDVAVIGGGAAGIAAGLEALEAGADVLVVEQFPDPGGTAVISGGGCLAVRTPLQEQAGIDDSTDQAFEDWLSWGGPGVDPVWARYYIEHSRDDVYFWAEENGVTWSGLKQHEGNSVPRWVQPEQGGVGMMRALIARYRTKGGRFLTSTTARRLRFKSRGVCGIETRTDAGHPVHIASTAVIVATGGFASNLDLVRRERSDLAGDRILVGSGPGATGSGHQLVAEAGGTCTHMDRIWFYAYATPDPRDPSGSRGFVIRNVPGYVWVNQQGVRFHDESLSGGKTGTRAVLAQRPRHCWAIVDASMTSTIDVVDPYYHPEGVTSRARIDALIETSPYIKKGASLENLAAAIGVPSAPFVESITRYNRAFSDGLAREPEHGKPLKGSRPLAAPPFYAIQMFPLARKTLGGVRTDLRCRVLDEHSNPVVGLYAAGEVAGMAGGHINGEAALEGTMLGPSLFSGRVAGGWAAYDCGFGQGFVGSPNTSTNRRPIESRTH